MKTAKPKAKPRQPLISREQAERAIGRRSKNEKQIERFRKGKARDGIPVTDHAIAQLCAPDPIDFRIHCRPNTAEEDAEEADECDSQN